jgi:hypothetical protein
MSFHLIIEVMLPLAILAAAGGLWPRISATPALVLWLSGFFVRAAQHGAPSGSH